MYLQRQVFTFSLTFNINLAITYSNGMAFDLYSLKKHITMTYMHYALYRQSFVELTLCRSAFYTNL